MKIIFLDMDGVLNSMKWFEERKASGKSRFETLDDAPVDITDPRAWTGMIDPKAMARLNRILEATGADLVISSSWRHAHSVTKMQKILNLAGLLPKANVIGNTPTFAGPPRAAEIMAYIETIPNIKSFVVLDDGSSAGEGLEKWFVKTDLAYGLQDEHVTRAIRILGPR